MPGKMFKRAKSGRVFEETFLDGIRSDKFYLPDYSMISITDKARLVHGVIDSMILCNIDLSEYVIEVDMDYLPEDINDKGGFVVQQAENNQLEFINYYDPDDGAVNYPGLRLYKRGAVYEAYYKDPITLGWKRFGIKLFNSTDVKSGLILKGSTGDTLDINKIKVYTNLSILMDNIIVGHIVQLFDDDDNLLVEDRVPVGQNYVKINVSNIELPVTGYFKILDESDVLVAQSAVMSNISPGDEYEYGQFLDMYVNEQLDEGGSEIYAGSGNNDLNIKLENNHESVTFNITVRVMQYNSEFGYQWTNIALMDHLGEVVGPYSTELPLTILPLDFENFRIKIEKTEQVPIRDCYVSIEIS